MTVPLDAAEPRPLDAQNYLLAGGTATAGEPRRGTPV
jgi:hypothetical protein